MATEFTPGPWTAYEFGADWYVGTNADDSGPMLRVGSIHADRGANANLISAAPDLYDALEDAVQFLGNGWPEQIEARGRAMAALAKARGEQVSA